MDAYASSFYAIYIDYNIASSISGSSLNYSISIARSASTASLLAGAFAEGPPN
jgi:hypothetical protein